MIHSRAGYYLGREQYDKQMEVWHPYNRVSSYIKEHDKAEKLLEQAKDFKRAINIIAPTRLDQLAAGFTDKCYRNKISLNIS